MYIPEYSITPKILKNISMIEYGKAVIENTPILPSWENQIKKETKVSFLQSYLSKVGLRYDQTIIKGFLENIGGPIPLEFYDVKNTLDIIDELSSKKEFSEKDVKEIAKTLTHKVGYRNIKMQGKPVPEEILARIVQFFDWYSSLDGKETHPVLLSGITKIFFLGVSPFKDFNGIISDILSLLSLKSSGYELRNMVCMDNYFNRSVAENNRTLEKSLETSDLTIWLEYFTEGLSVETLNTKEKVKLLARDTKIAKATGRTKFTPRQERIVEYLQDYAILQNKDFPRVFPNVSEDSILRDLKVLIQKGVIQKSGSTKSSLYELA